MSTALDGGCFCGRIRYRIHEHTGLVAHCHCINCRRASGGTLVTWVDVKRDRLEWLSGTPRVYEHASDLAPRVVRQFCGDCGSSLTWDRPESEEIDVAVVDLDDPEGVEPTCHCFAPRQLSWLHLSDDLPRHQRGEASPRV